VLVFTYMQLSDFISQVHRRIHTERTPENVTDERLRLDSAGFWREAYERTEANQAQLLDRIYELEQRLEISQPSQSQGGTGNTAKRKNESLEDGESLANKRKRQSKPVEDAGGGSKNMPVITETERNEGEYRHLGTTLQWLKPLQ
jgi:hypothetical protein